MKNLAFLLLAIAGIAVLSGCSTLSQNDRTVLDQHHVSASLYERMSHRDPLEISDIIELSRRQVPNRFIVHYLDSTDTTFRLSKGEISQLRKAGVSSEVIDYLLDTAPVYSRRPSYYYSAYPAYGPYPYYPGDYYYGGGTTVIFRGGGGYSHRGWR